MDRDRAKGAYEEYKNNLINVHHVSEKELVDFDQFMGILISDIPTPVVCDIDAEIRERKRIFEQFARAFEEAGVYEWRIDKL